MSFRSWLAVSILLLGLGMSLDASAQNYQIPCSPNTAGGCTAYSATNPLPTSSASGAVTITQSIVALSAATSATLIAANASRKYLCWMNVGTAPMTVAPGAVTVTAGHGMNYDPGSSASNQGGAFCQENASISRQAFSAISTAGTTVTVWEGQ